MVAGVVHLSGAFGGNMRGPNSNNQKGMFENAAIGNDIVKPYYRGMNVDPLGQYPLPDIDKLLIPSNWQKDVEHIIASEGYKEGPWFYKGAKMCQHWPVWNYAFPDAKWIIVRRKTPDIIRSCMRTGFMRAFNSMANRKAVGASDEYDAWLWWVHEHEKRFEEMIREGLNCKQVWPERMVDGNYTQMKEMLEWLGLEPDLSKIMNFIEPKLWKARMHKK
jgi:hypothetical protein